MQERYRAVPNGATIIDQPCTHRGEAPLRFKSEFEALISKKPPESPAA